MIYQPLYHDAGNSSRTMRDEPSIEAL